MDDLEYTDEQKKSLIEGIYAGLIGLSTLPKNLYKATAKTLKKALYKGYGGTLLKFDTDSSDYALLKELRDNIYIFSAAKTATQVVDIRNLMFEGDQIVSLQEFKKRALVMFDTYNKDWLDSEYITAQTSGSSASNWNYTQQHKDLFPKLRSVVIMDDVTAPECERMNGVVASVDDPIWDHNLSPRHFRCRCHEERIDKYENEPVSPKSMRDKIMAENEKDMHPVFKMNPGKDRYVFSPHHAYFDIAKKYKVRAKRNFNLPIPKTDENPS
jgi:SPP1 gp7 family putative phage head morphogenesis protein